MDTEGCRGDDECACVRQLLNSLRDEWDRATRAQDWDAAFSQLTDEWRAVEWRSGGKTLMSALGLQYQEVPLCRGLAWLLDPDGGHRMGRHLVDAFLSSLGLPVVDGEPVTIRVVEAKVHAAEQPEQADRLWGHWADETLTLVFLTRTGYLPYTARKSEGHWVPRTWRDMAQLARTVADKAGLEPSAGAREFIETIGAL